MARKEVPSYHATLKDIHRERTTTYETFKTVDYIDKVVSYEYFFENYLIPNKLCIIGPWLTKSWLSRNKWKNQDGSPNLDYLQEQFGNVKCPIADCSREEYGSHPKSELSFTEYVEYLRRYRDAAYSREMPCLYLKDWHCVRSFPGYRFYETPLFFQSDWLNEFWDERSDNICDDYRFVYIGPKGSWTPFHSDVLRSNSWSANVCGSKKWIFYPPGAEEHLRDKFGQLPYDLRRVDEEKYPDFHRAQAKRLEVYQNEGEVVFVPSGWHHQVFNLEDTISMNHNWLNGCNIDICWRFLQTSYKQVMREIEDCKDMDGWHQQCQLILKSTSGIDYVEFYHFLELIAQKRLDSLENVLHQTGKSVGIEIDQQTEGPRHRCEKSIPCEVTESTELSDGNTRQKCDQAEQDSEFTSECENCTEFMKNCGNCAEFMKKCENCAEFMKKCENCAGFMKKCENCAEFMKKYENCAEFMKKCENCAEFMKKCENCAEFMKKCENCAEFMEKCENCAEFMKKCENCAELLKKCDCCVEMENKREQCAGLKRKCGSCAENGMADEFLRGVTSGNQCREHVVFDLTRIDDILQSMLQDEHFVETLRTNSDLKPVELMEKLSKCLKLFIT